MKTKWVAVISYPAMLAFSLGAIVFLNATFRNTVADPDIWWHLRNADLVMHAGSLPRVDSYSFTVAGRPWMDSEWLSELPFWVAWRWAQERGLFALTVLLMEGVVLGIYYLAFLRTRDIKGSFFAALTGLLLAMVSFAPRPLLFGWLLFVTELIILERWEQHKGTLWIMPPLFLLWINLHGSWLIGIIYFAIFAACGCIDGHWGLITFTRRPGARRAHVTGALLSSVPALLVNPFGWRAVWFPFDMAFVQKINTVVNQEWQSINFQQGRGYVVFGLLGLLVIASLLRKREWHAQDLAFLVVAVYAAFAHARFLFLLGIVICPLLAREWNGFRAYDKHRDRPALNAAVIVILITVCALRFPTSAQLRADMTESMPVKAVEFLRANPPSGRILNDIDWGGYLILQAPELPVFADSRDDIFEREGVLGDYMNVLQIQSPLEVMDKYRISSVLLPRSAPISCLLRATPGWTPVYEDSTAVVLRREPGDFAASR